MCGSFFQFEQMLFSCVNEEKWNRIWMQWILYGEKLLIGNRKWTGSYRSYRMCCLWENEDCNRSPMSLNSNFGLEMSEAEISGLKYVNAFMGISKKSVVYFFLFGREWNKWFITKTNWMIHGTGCLDCASNFIYLFYKTFTLNAIRHNGQFVIINNSNKMEYVLERVKCIFHALAIHVCCVDRLFG